MYILICSIPAPTRPRKSHRFIPGAPSSAPEITKGTVHRTRKDRCIAPGPEVQRVPPVITILDHNIHPEIRNIFLSTYIHPLPPQSINPPNPTITSICPPLLSFYILSSHPFSLQPLLHSLFHSIFSHLLLSNTIQSCPPAPAPTPQASHS
jgi:hypothetical protein